MGEFESVDTAPAVTHVSFQDRKTAEKFYYSLHNKELPGVPGTLELQWVNTPLPPVEVKSSANATDRDRDDAMASMDEPQPRRESPEVQHVPRERTVNMDYEEADEEIW